MRSGEVGELYCNRVSDPHELRESLLTVIVILITNSQWYDMMFSIEVVSRGGCVCSLVELLGQGRICKPAFFPNKL